MATSYSDILLTDDGDIDLSTDSVIFIDSNQLSLRQRLNMRFAIWQGEWKYNALFGTPYKSYVGKPTTKSAMDAEIKRQIFKETDVISINSFSSSLDRQARTYTCIAIISTREEDSLTYLLNLRDNFEYIQPNINETCKKIIRYSYVTSKPYPILAQDYTNNQLSINDGLIKDITKETEATQLIFKIDSGTLRDSLQQYTYETEYVESSCSVLEMTLTFVAPPVTPDYNAGYEYMEGSSAITSMTLTDVLVPYTHPLEDYVSVSSSITSMTLTG